MVIGLWFCCLKQAKLIKHIVTLKRPEWLGISDISKVFVNTSQLGNCFSNVLVAYSYHHQGIMTRKHSCIYKDDDDSK